MISYGQNRVYHPLGFSKNLELLNFCTATAQKKSFLYFCILTQKRGIGSKKVISCFLLPPNKVEAERIIFLPRFFHSHMFGLGPSLNFQSPSFSSRTEPEPSFRASKWNSMYCTCPTSTSCITPSAYWIPTQHGVQVQHGVGVRYVIGVIHKAEVGHVLEGGHGARGWTWDAAPTWGWGRTCT